jgi:hypothetical protein
VIGILLLAAGGAAVAVGATLVAASLRLASLTSFLLCAWLVACAGVITLSFVLSAVGALGRPGLLAGLAVLVAAAAIAWAGTGRPAAPPVRSPLRELRSALRDPLLAALTALLALAYAYLSVVAIAIPQVDWDVLIYHLPRAALWLQDGGIGLIPAVPDERLNSMPPGAEILVAATMGIARSDRFVALPQLLAVPITMVAITGVARRCGLDRRAALFGALLFASFPVVALQAPTALNDLVVVPPLVAAVHFSLGRRRTEHALVALALAVALMTKITAALALPVLVAIVAVALPPKRLVSPVIAGLAGCAAGSGWYVANRVRTGSFDGDLGAVFDQVPDRSPGAILARSLSYLTHFFDLSGAVGGDRLWFPVAGGVLVLVAGAVFGRRRPVVPRTLALSAVVVALVPWTVDLVHHVVVHGFARGLIAVGQRDRIAILPGEVSADASPVFSWYGAAFALVYVPCLVLCARAVARRTRPPIVLALAVAPLLFVPVMGAAITLDELRGRFFAFAIALAAAAFGQILRVRPLAIATGAAAVVTVALCLVHVDARAIGIRLLEPVEAKPAWGLTRAQAFAGYARDNRDDPEAFRFLAGLPLDATVALALARDTYIYPAFDRAHRRQVVFVPRSGPVPANAGWLVVGPRRSAPSAVGWTQVLDLRSGWRAFRRR